jgi:single-strand DNA-binding protein
MSVNKVILIGRLGKDPEIRTTQDGREIANFSLATSEKWKDKTTGEKKEKTEWHRIVVFNPNIVGVVKSYVKKGSHIWVEGQLCTRKWQDKEGRDIYTTEVVLQAYNGSIQLLDSKKEGRSENNDYSSYDKGYDPASVNPHRMGEPPQLNITENIGLDDEILF